MELALLGIRNLQVLNQSIKLLIDDLDQSGFLSWNPNLSLRISCSAIGELYYGKMFCELNNLDNIKKISIENAIRSFENICKSYKDQINPYAMFKNTAIFTLTCVGTYAAIFFVAKEFVCKTYA